MKNKDLTDREIIDFLASKLMRWKAPLSLPEGTYISVYENEQYTIGSLIGYRHSESDKFYTLKEFEQYEYWTTIDGKPAKAPWGGLVHKSVYWKWNPLVQTPDGYFQCFGPGGVVDRMRGLGFNFNLNHQQLPEIKICIAQFHKICDGLIYGSGNDEDGTARNRAVCLAAVEALKEKKNE